MFERLSIEDTAVLLVADKRLIGTACAIAIAEIHANLAQHRDWATALSTAAQQALAVMEPMA